CEMVHQKHFFYTRPANRFSGSSSICIDKSANAEQRTTEIPDDNGQCIGDIVGEKLAQNRFARTARRFAVVAASRQRSVGTESPGITVVPRRGILFHHLPEQFFHIIAVFERKGQTNKPRTPVSEKGFAFPGERKI